MGDTELGTEDDDVDVDLQASASVELRSRWVDEATEVIVDRRGVEVAAVCGDPDVTPPSAQPDDGEAYFSRWHSHEDVARDQEPDASITKKRTIRHLVSLNPAHTAEHRRALQNEQRWRTEVGLLDGPVRAINLGLGDLETRLRLPPETIGRLPHVLGWWIDMGDGLAEGELAERGARGPFLSICQRRLDGRTLHDLVPSTTGLQPSDAADITEAAALTLSGVHDAGHWFGDISEHNLLAYAYWHSDDGATSSPSRLVRPRLRRRWLVNLCDVEQLAFRGSEEPGGMLWGATKPYATVMPGDRGPSYESELANLAYRACLLFFGRTKENQCPSGPDPESGLPTPLIGLLRRAGRSAELRRASHDGVLAPELRSIADFGRWVRILTPLPDERPGSYVARVDTACNRSSVSTAVLADLISWARSPGGPTSDSLALAYAAKIALENAERFDDVDRARFEAAELLVKAVNAVDVQRLRALLDAAGLDPATLRADINPNKHGEAIARLAQAYPEAGWQQPATPPGATTTRALRARRVPVQMPPASSAVPTPPPLPRRPRSIVRRGPSPTIAAPPSILSLRPQRRAPQPFPFEMQWADEVDDGEEQAFPPRFLTDGWLRRVEEQLQHLQVRDPTVASGVYEVVIERFPDLSFIFSVEHGRILGITRGHDPAARSATKIDPARLWELLIDSVRPIVGHQAADHDAVWVLRRLAPPHRALQRLTQWNPEVGDEPPGRDRPARGVAVVLGLGRLRA